MDLVTILWIAIPTVILISFVIYVLRAPGCIFKVYTKPPRLGGSKTPGNWGSHYEDFSFESQGAMHAAWKIFPPHYDCNRKFPVVVMTHGFAINKNFMADRSVKIAEAGFIVIAFDWRAHGGSGGDICSGGILETQDLINVLEVLRSHEDLDLEHIGVYGFSMGASIAILAAAQDSSFKCVIADSPFASLDEMIRSVIDKLIIPSAWIYPAIRKKFRNEFGEPLEQQADVLRQVAKLPRGSLLLLAGKKDIFVPFRQIEKLVKAVPEGTIVEINEEGGHFANGSDETMKRLIIPFLNSHLSIE